MTVKTRRYLLKIETLPIHPGKVMISGYESVLYNDYLKNWNIASKDTQVERGLQRKEVIWMNY
jgi:DNA adenine methylase